MRAVQSSRLSLTVFPRALCPRALSTALVSLNRMVELDKMYLLGNSMTDCRKIIAWGMNDCKTAGLKNVHAIAIELVERHSCKDASTVCIADWAIQRVSSEQIVQRIDVRCRLQDSNLDFIC